MANVSKAISIRSRHVTNSKLSPPSVSKEGKKNFFNFLEECKEATATEMVEHSLVSAHRADTPQILYHTAPTLSIGIYKK